MVETNRQENANDCYFEEDTYSVSGFFRKGIHDVKVWTGCSQWSLSDPDCNQDCEFQEHNEVCFCYSSSNYHPSGQADPHFAITKIQASGDDKNTDACSDFIENIRQAELPNGWCNIEGDTADATGLYILLKRKNVVILKEDSTGSFYMSNQGSFNTVQVGYRQMFYWEARNEYHVEYHGGKEGTHLKTKVNIDFTDNISDIGKVCSNGRYVQIGVGSNTTFYAYDGTFKSISNRNVTMSKNVCIEANGTSILKQTLIAEL